MKTIERLENNWDGITQYRFFSQSNRPKRGIEKSDIDLTLSCGTKSVVGVGVVVIKYYVYKKYKCLFCFKRCMKHQTDDERTVIVSC